VATHTADHANPGQVFAHDLHHIDLGRRDNAQAHERSLVRDDIEGGLDPARSSGRFDRHAEADAVGRFVSVRGDGRPIPNEGVGAERGGELEPRLVKLS